MKTFVCALVLIAVVVAEPPRYRQSRFRLEQREVSTTEGERESTTQKNEAPYPAAGFIPPREFVLPTRQELPPATSYGVPANSYGSPLLTYVAPQTEYGVPEKSEGEEKGDTEEKGEEGKKSEGESREEEDDEEGEELDEGHKKKEKKEKSKHEVVNTGAYYILLPDSQLQRVQFRTENDFANMAYTARLQYRNEERAPVFVYTAVPVPAAPQQQQQQFSQYTQFPSNAYVQW